MEKRKTYHIQICHPCGHCQEHAVKAYCQGQAYEISKREMFPYLCDDCLDKTGTRSNPIKHDA